jgi:hypothetical protein
LPRAQLIIAPSISYFLVCYAQYALDVAVQGLDKSWLTTYIHTYVHFCSFLGFSILCVTLSLPRQKSALGICRWTY